MPRRPLLPVALLAVALGAVTACSSSAKRAESTTVPASGTTAGAPAPSTPTGSTAAAPAVTNATDLKKEPQVAPGSGAPPAQLVVKDLVVASGPVATASSTVTIQYVGANYADGKVFDASWTRGQPAQFQVSGVIPGFAQALTGMHVGSRREVVIPPALGYGAQGSPPAVGPNETLVFVIDLLAVQ